MSISTRIVYPVLAALLPLGIAQVCAGGELDAWTAADGCADYRAFLAAYPDGKLAPIATRRLQDCPPEPAAASPQPVVQPHPAYSPPSTPATGTTENQARALVERLIAVTNAADVEAMVALFANPARYFAWGSTSHASIRKDKRAYFRRWPRVRYELAAPLRIGQRTGGDLSVEIDLSYEVFSPQRDERASGMTRNTLVIGPVGGAPRIKSIQETVLHRDRR